MFPNLPRIAAGLSLGLRPAVEGCVDAADPYAVAVRNCRPSVSTRSSNFSFRTRKSSQNRALLHKVTNFTLHGASGRAHVLPMPRTVNGFCGDSALRSREWANLRRIARHWRNTRGCANGKTREMRNKFACAMVFVFSDGLKTSKQGGRKFQSILNAGEREAGRSNSLRALFLAAADIFRAVLVTIRFMASGVLPAAKGRKYHRKKVKQATSSSV